MCGESKENCRFNYCLQPSLNLQDGKRCLIFGTTSSDMGSEIAMEIDSDRPDRPSLTHSPKSFGIHLVKWTGVGGEFWFPWPVVPRVLHPFQRLPEVNLVSPQRRNHQLPCKSQELG